ncbi:MAG: NAD(P)/FAD-dependent oxidoreductase [Rhizobiales bacterium]|nr:NAD(P)/FAD-dependent oxidoreductase [Hyphomicrobiales bacterium]
MMAVGIRPETRLAEDAGIVRHRGIVVGDQLQTSAPDVYAIGECAEHQGTCYGLVWPVNEQADVLAAHLTGDPSSAYQGSAIFTSLKISGVDLFSAGRFSDEEGGERLTLRDPARGVYRRLLVEEDRLKGAVLLGDAADGAWYASLIRAQVPLNGLRDRMMFGEALVNGHAPALSE